MYISLIGEVMSTGLMVMVLHLWDDENFAQQEHSMSSFMKLAFSCI